MMDNSDLQQLSEAELVARYVETVHAWNGTEHVGAQNRIMDRRMRIVDLLKERSAGTLQPLRSLLDHPDPHVRYSAAFRFRTIDHAAFERTVVALAERHDELGDDARESLEWDKFFQERGYPEAEVGGGASLPANANAARLHWQSNHPPPDAMPASMIERLLAENFPAAAAERLHRLVRPAIELWPQRPPANMPVGSSRFGGMPHAPAAWSWPMVESEPMLFLGQIDCAALKSLPAAERLPSDGVLAFFGDHDAVMGCAFGSQDVALFYWPDRIDLELATPPVEPALVLPLCALAFRPASDLPDPHSRAVQPILTDSGQLARYAAIVEQSRRYGIEEDVFHYCGFSKVFGWPSLVQPRDLDDISERFGRDGLHLLLQIDQYSNGEDSHDWGPGGSLYFSIHDDDLRARRFERCEFEMQFT